MSNTAILIPARYKSTRFPGKPLCDLGGKTMIERVYERCKKSGLDTYVLTDDMRVARLFTWETCWIDQSVPYENGTERCAGAINDNLCSLFKSYDKFINVQGDMPDVTVEMIEKVEWHLKNYNVVTLFTDMPKEMQEDQNSVKMVRSGDKALWFGRGMTGYGDWHLGIYGYRRNALHCYPTYKIEIEEQVEKLEQLRWLKAGWDIGCLKVNFDGLEINSPEDAIAWNLNRYKNATP